METQSASRLASVLLITLAIAGGSLVAPAAAQNGSHPAVAPVIEDLEVNADAGLAPGSSLEFTLRGTPRSEARVQVPGSGLNLILREPTPGVYRGSYTVRRADRIDPAALIRASLGGSHLRTAASFRFPPSFAARQQPAPAQEADAGAPAQQPAGAPAEARIDRFAMAPVDRLEPGTELQFTVDGAPNARVTIDLPGRPNAVALRELRPGRYVGAYTLRRQDALEPGPVLALLRSGDRTVTARLATPLPASGVSASRGTRMGAGAGPVAAPERPLELQVTSPNQNDAVDANQVLVQGRTAPHASVQVKVDAVPPASPGRLSVAQSVMQQSLQADANGDFSFGFGPFRAVPGTRFEVLLSATRGPQSTPEQRLVLVQRQG
ncbi:MAG: hypothetical protein AVDCRST_MAG51-2603 [uncultured Ramlibacter sp.]|uniref:Uncharacterized protein n=1 Tax=uncultured Ramlibacter sp. TaxID=260755 RepID=A0A6J4PZG9_9BURK|nr:MAG: hypothetical protein AVDCRST_MAG51-2603 [uncultured Ramlibacter sp.]